MAKQTSHSTLIPTAKKIAKLLKSKGYFPYPGIINPKAGKGGTTRITIREEASRVVLIISSAGVQEVYLYGQIDIVTLYDILMADFDNVVIRNRKN